MNDRKSIATQLFKSGIFLLIGSVVGSLGGFLGRTITARLLPTGTYGALALTLSILTASATIILLGFDQGLGRYLPRRDEPTEQRTFLIAAFSTSAPIAVVVGFLFVWAGPTIGSAFSDNIVVGRMFRFLGIALPCIVITRLCIGGIQGLELTLPKTIVQDFTVPVSRLSLIGLVILVGVTTTNIVLAYLFSFIAGAIVACYFLIKSAPLSWHGALTVHKLGRKRRELLSFSIPLTITGVMSVVFSNIDTVMLGYFTTTTEVGIYDVAFLVAKFLVVILGSFLFLFMPLFSRLHSEGEGDKMEHIYTLVTKWVFIISLPLFMLLTWFPDTVIGLTFGQNYVSELPILGVLALGFFTNVSTGPNGNAMIALGETRFIMLINVSVALLNLILNGLLIPRFSVLGAAIATATSYMILNIGTSIGLFLETDIQPINIPLAKLFGIAMIYFGAIEGIFTLANIGSYLLDLIAFSFFMLVYPFIVLWGVEFQSSEISVLDEIEDQVGVGLGFLKRLMR